MIDIEMFDETETLTGEHFRTVRDLLKRAASCEGLPGDTECSVTFVDHDKIRCLNRTYRQTDRTTDVLSFPMQEANGGEPDIPEVPVPHQLGDIVISVPKAREQAKVYGHSFMREIGFLAVHGFLHLCGYDHDTETGEQTMFARQKEILESYGLRR